MSSNPCGFSGLGGGPDRTRICDLYRVKVAWANNLRERH